MRVGRLAVGLAVVGVFLAANYHEWLAAGRPPLAPAPARRAAPAPPHATGAGPAVTLAVDLGDPLRRSAVPLGWPLFNQTRVVPGTRDIFESYPDSLLRTEGRMVRMVGMAALRWNAGLDAVDGLLRPMRLEGCCGQVCEHPLLQTLYLRCSAGQPWPLVSPVPMAAVTGRLVLTPARPSGYFYCLNEAIAEPLEIPSLDVAPRVAVGD